MGDSRGIHFLVEPLNSALTYHVSLLTGDGDDYLNLALKDGGMSLSLNLGNGRLDTGINPTSIRFDDDNWHHVIITRVAREVFIFCLVILYFKSFGIRNYS